ncbi:MAG: transposase [Nitrospirota bacterium]
MARPLRIQYPGAVYHVTCRGNERKDIFKDDADRRKMLQILAESIKIYSVKIYSYVLMNNHFHLLLETPLGNLGESMRHFNITYTGYFNRRHRRVGHLYQGRYKSILVEKVSYLTILSRYIHLNPVRTRVMAKAQLRDKLSLVSRYPWSSLPGYLDKKKRETFVDYAMVLEEYGGETERARKAYAEVVRADIASGIEIKDKIFSQSILGRDEFIEWVKEKYIGRDKTQEIPAAKEIQRYRSKAAILRAIEGETGKGIDEIKKHKGLYRQIAMELLYRIAGLKGREIGDMMGVGYTSVSQERGRLREKVERDNKLRMLMDRIEGHL